jgi:hypothetical protein
VSKLSFIPSLNSLFPFAIVLPLSRRAPTRLPFSPEQLHLLSPHLFSTSPPPFFFPPQALRYCTLDFFVLSVPLSARAELLI